MHAHDLSHPPVNHGSAVHISESVVLVAHGATHDVSNSSLTSVLRFQHGTKHVFFTGRSALALYRTRVSRAARVIAAHAPWNSRYGVGAGSVGFSSRYSLSV